LRPGRNSVQPLKRYLFVSARDTFEVASQPRDESDR
jgi:hypothetical protein